MFAHVSQHLDFETRQPCFSCQRAHIIYIKHDWMSQSYLMHYCVPRLSQTPFVYIIRLHQTGMPLSSGRLRRWHRPILVVF